MTIVPLLLWFANVIARRERTIHAEGLMEIEPMPLRSASQGSYELDEAEWHVAAVEARIMLEMRNRAMGGPIDDQAMCVMFDDLEQANARVRALKAGMDAAALGCVSDRSSGAA